MFSTARTELRELIRLVAGIERYAEFRVAHDVLAFDPKSSVRVTHSLSP